jgi:outer membrane protein assembly factor BamB
MKTSRLILLFSTLFIVSSLLSACAGGANTTTSWPGLTVNPDQSIAYLADAQFVYAVDLTNGTEKWRFPTKGDPKVTFYAAPSLTSDGQLIVGDYNKVLHSLDPSTGLETQGKQWPFTQATDRYIGSALAADKQIYAPNADKFLYALDSSGNQIWEFPTQAALWAPPAWDGKYLYLAAMDHIVYKLDPVTGKQVWASEDLGGAMIATPAIGPDGTLYVGTFNSELVALNGQDGKVLWKAPAAGWVWASPVLVGDTLYYGDLSGTMHALGLDGKVKWSVQPDSTSSHRAIVDKALVAKDTLYFSSETGTLYALDITNGNTRWGNAIGGKLYAGPAAANDLILVAPMGLTIKDKGTALLVALDSNGSQKWSFVPGK